MASTYPGKAQAAKTCAVAVVRTCNVWVASPECKPWSCTLQHNRLQDIEIAEIMQQDAVHTIIDHNRPHSIGAASCPMFPTVCASTAVPMPRSTAHCARLARPMPLQTSRVLHANFRVASQVWSTINREVQQEECCTLHHTFRTCAATMHQVQLTMPWMFALVDYNLITAHV
jgi:hypothetical protein